MRRILQGPAAGTMLPPGVFLLFPLSVFCASVFCEMAAAQNVTVQQPALGRFSVGTSVVVPDRGRAFLGSVSRAGESRSRFGPFPSGTSTGLFREHTGLSTRVWIHDLREMDRLLLQQGRISAETNTGPPLSPAAEQAYRTLQRRRGTAPSRTATIDSGRSISRLRTPVFADRTKLPAVSSSNRSFRSFSPATNRAVPRTSESPADLYYRLGQQAERSGNYNKAAYCYRLAARYGSKAAAQMLSAGRLFRRPLYRR